MQVDIKDVESLSYLFLRVVGKIFLAPYSSDTCNEMTGAQKRILFYLDLEGPKKMSDVARLVAVTTPAATAVVDKLVKQDLVTREPDTVDRRIIRVALSENGRRTVDELKLIHERRLEDILSRLDADKRAQLIESFERIHEILTEIDTPAA
jgi:DNA-binding MarR family transcriptional regulator